MARNGSGCYALIAIAVAFGTCSARADLRVADLGAYMNACVEVNGFNGSVLVAKDGVTVFSKGYGMANLEHGIANTPTTKFRIGSITKQFTAMAVMVLEGQGTLDVHDAVGKYLADAPATWEGVTIHHLLTHTSGIPSYTGMPEYGRDMMLPQSVGQMVSRFRDKPLDFPPGEQFRYSNSGYFLLGAIIEKGYEKMFTPEKRDYAYGWRVSTDLD